LRSGDSAPARRAANGGLILRSRCAISAGFADSPNGRKLRDARGVTAPGTTDFDGRSLGCGITLVLLFATARNT